jgi:ABC-2 type transport system ATP-binding protein
VFIIEASGLARTFKARGGMVEAVRGVDLSVDAGEIVGFLGPNGAGKTTTLRMLTTLIRPTAGTATVAGSDLLKDPAGVRRRIGYVAQSGGTEALSTVSEELMLQADLYRIEKDEARKRAEMLVKQLDLTGLEDRQTKTLSGGQRRRLDIALGLVHQPPLVFLDEPTSGLDPQSRSNMWDHIRRLRQELSTTVFLTTHYLEEADALCDRILIIDYGKIVAEGTPKELKESISGDVATIGVGGDPEAARRVLADRPGVREASVVDRAVRLNLEQGEQAVLGLVKALEAAGIEPTSLRLDRPSLDDVFLTLTGRSLREEGV